MRGLLFLKQERGLHIPGGPMGEEGVAEEDLRRGEGIVVQRVQRFPTDGGAVERLRSGIGEERASGETVERDAVNPGLFVVAFL